MKKCLAMAVFSLVLLGALGFSGYYEEGFTTSLDPSTTASTDHAWSHSLKLKVYFNGSLLVEYIGKNTTYDEGRSVIEASINFTKRPDSVLTKERVTLSFPLPISFNIPIDTTTFEGVFNLDLYGEGSYADGIADGMLIIFPSVELDLISILFDPILIKYNVTETRLCVHLNTTIYYYEPIINYTVVKDLLNYANETMGFNQTFINSAICECSNGELECSTFKIECVNETDRATIDSSLIIEGNVIGSLPYIFANLTGLAPIEESAATAIESKIETALDWITNSSYTLTSDDGLLTYTGTVFFVSTLDSSLSELKNSTLDDFLNDLFPDIGSEESDFLYGTDLAVSDLSIRYRSDPDEVSLDIDGLFLRPPVEWLNATDFTIPGLFNVCDGLFTENLTTFVIEGERNSTHEVKVIIPPGAPKPSGQSSVIWTNIDLSHLSGVTFEIVSLAPPFVLTLQDVFSLTAITGLIVATVVMVFQYRKKSSAEEALIK